MRTSVRNARSCDHGGREKGEQREVRAGDAAGQEQGFEVQLAERSMGVSQAALTNTSFAAATVTDLLFYPHWLLEAHSEDGDRHLEVPSAGRDPGPSCCRSYLEELALVEAIKVVFSLALRTEQEVEEGKPHLPIKFGHLHLVLRGHHVPCAILKLLELA